MSVAIIPARGGSSRIPRKNIRPFFGKPIIAYSIATALATKLFDRIYVSTEDPEIAGVAVAHGAQVLTRPSTLAANEVGTQDVMAHACSHLKLNPAELVACIYATAPLMRVTDLLRAAAMLEQRPLSPYVYSCALKPLRNYDLLHDAGQFYLGQAGTFVAGVPLTADDVLKLIVPNEFVCDINEEADWARAEQMYAAAHGVTT